MTRRRSVVLSPVNVHVGIESSTPSRHEPSRKRKPVSRSSLVRRYARGATGCRRSLDAYATAPRTRRRTSSAAIAGSIHRLVDPECRPEVVAVDGDLAHVRPEVIGERPSGVVSSVPDDHRGVVVRQRLHVAADDPRPVARRRHDLVVARHRSHALGRVRDGAGPFARSTDHLTGALAPDAVPDEIADAPPRTPRPDVELLGRQGPDLCAERFDPAGDRRRQLGEGRLSHSTRPTPCRAARRG